MKQATLKQAALAMILAVGCYSANAQTNSINVVTTAVPFLRISPDARSGGMGDVGIATRPDANSSFWNLAKSTFADGKGGVTVNYTPWLKDLDLKDVYLASAAGYYKLSDNQAITGSFRYFSLGNIQFTDANGNYLQSQRPREFAIDAGYARKLSSKNSLGIAIRYINSQLATGDVNGVTYKAGTSVAGDIHFYHHGAKENGAGLNWGVTLSNLGSKISYTNDATQKDYIPANLGIGAAYTKVFDADNKLTIAADLNKLLVPTPPVQGTESDSAYSVRIKQYRDKGVVSSWFSSFGDSEQNGGELREVTASIGAEYWYKNQFAFRAGYFYEHPDKGNRKFFTFGAGLKYNMIGINLSYLLPTGNGITRNPLSNTLRFGLVFDIK